MLEKNLSEQILSIGNRSDRPDGGISQVLYNYRFYVFPVFKSITNFKIGSKPYKLFIAILALLKEFLIFSIKKLRLYMCMLHRILVSDVPATISI